MSVDNGKQKKSTMRRILRRGPWENTATALILIGVLMLVQPFSKWAFANGLAVLLIGTVGFTIVSHFPED